MSRLQSCPGALSELHMLRLTHLPLDSGSMVPASAGPRRLSRQSVAALCSLAVALTRQMSMLLC
jgi:hypothetical protein